MEQHITLERLGEFRQFSHIEDFKSKEQAEAAHARFSPDSMALITTVDDIPIKSWDEFK